MRDNKILIVCCILILIAVASIRLFVVEKKVMSISSGEVISEDNTDIEIIDKSNYIRLLSDTIDIQNLFWIDDSNIYFEKKEINSNRNNAFLFNLSKKEIQSTEQQTYDSKFMEYKNKDLKVLEKVNAEHFLGLAKIGQYKSLVYVADNNIIEILKDIDNNEKLLYIISSNKEKVAFYDPKKDKISIYNFINNRSIDLDQEITDYIKNNFKESISFSFQAGYLTISHINKDINNSYFTVFGADSGKIYGEKIMGLKPVWNNKSLSIAYIYNGNKSKVCNYGLNSEEAVGKIIGVYDLRSKKFRYTQPLENNVSITTPILWSKDDATLYFKVGQYSSKNDTFSIEGIYGYNILENILYNMEMDFLKEYNNNVVEMNLKKDNLILYGVSKDDEESFIRFIDLNNRNYTTIYNILSFNLYVSDIGLETCYKYITDSNLFYIRDNSLYITDFQSNELLHKFDGKLLGLYPSPNWNNILLVSSIDNNIELAIIDLRGYIKQ